MKTGFITIIGRPNVGKSTLLNAIIGEKIAIVTDKPQTTRSRIVGIYNEEEVQFIFVDTPGLHTPKNKLGEYMVKEAYEAADDVDCAIVVTEPKPPKATEIRLIERFNKDGIPMILVVNKTDKYPREEVAKTIAEYAKRLSRYCKLEIIEVADEKTPDHASDTVNQQILFKEGERIQSMIPKDSYVIALAIEGKKYDSVEFAGMIENAGIRGISNITFIIGGSLGIQEEIKKAAQGRISFSDMTFPHQLMRVILLEQIYRGYKIITKEPYHK